MAGLSRGFKGVTPLSYFEIMEEVNFDDDPNRIWATQAQIATFFDVTPQNIIWHLKQIYGEVVLLEESTCKESLQVCEEGGRDKFRTLNMYNFEIIIEIGNRINTDSAKEFRRWLFGLLMMYLKGSKPYKSACEPGQVPWKSTDFTSDGVL